ncbi:MAG: M36 family metallopeptidase [Saprospiraceae bacterium]
MNAQIDKAQIKNFLETSDPTWSKAEFVIQSNYYDEVLKLNHIYIQEQIKDLPVYPEISSLHLNSKDELMYSTISSPRFLEINQHIQSKSIDIPSLIKDYLGLHDVEAILTETNNRTRAELGFKVYTINNNNANKVLSQDCYYFRNYKLFRAVRIYFENKLKHEHWNGYLDIHTGKLIAETNELLNCDIATVTVNSKSQFTLLEHKETSLPNSCYRVFPIPIESPYHGLRSLVFSPWLKAANASPLGWHSDGQFNYVSSQGNNVDAYEDMDNDNLPTGGDAARAIGGININYDFSFDTTLSPPLNKNASISNLFYWNNIMHDVWYQYGFTEAAGNFQYNNFGKGGLDLDNVIAEGLDNINGSRNNANYSCPPDGFPGRLQSYIWQIPTYDTIIVEFPLAIKGKIVCVHSSISPNLLSPLTGTLALVNDGSAYPIQGCNPYINGAQINGKIALLDRGICNLNNKIIQAQNAGAIAMIVCNVDENIPSVMGGTTSGVGIPVINITKQQGDIFKAYIGQNIQLTLLPSSAYKYKTNGNSILFGRAAFGAKIPTSLNVNQIKVLDNQNNINDACDPITNNLSGQIAMIEDGNCEPSYKALKAQQNGALAVIIGRNTPGYPITYPSGTYGSMVTIPVICIAQSDYQSILSTLPSLGRLTNTLAQLVDVDFDGAIIAHEYGHGISIRLTGGPNNNQCLNNAEQAGEGWSDYFGLAMTMKASDIAYQNRGIGTWPSGQSNIAVGIRPFPYNVDLNINPANYGMLTDQIKISQPHGIGFVWCSMIWDMTWALITQYGFESDIYKSNSTAGNIKAFNLIMSGLKLQVCNPGFVDSRNAILKADSLLNGGVNSCIIWNVFARRGLGFSAQQESPFSRDDGIQAFNLPINCLPMTENQLFGSGTLENYFVKLAAVNKEDKIQLDWLSELPQDITKIEIIRKSNFENEKIIHSQKDFLNHYIDVDAINGIQYSYKVRIYSGSANILESNWASASLIGEDQWNIYPNPAQDQIYIENKNLRNVLVKVNLLNLAGAIIDDNEFYLKTKDKILLNTSDYPAGVYFISLSYDNAVQFIKFVNE